MTRRARGFNAWLFRIALRAFPGAFRREHGSEMEHLFLTRLNRASGLRARTALVARMLRDAAVSAAAVRSRERRRARIIGHRGGRDMLWQDIRFGVRHLIRTPVFTIGAALLLAVGIGSNIAVFSLLDHFILRPPEFDRPEEVVFVYQDSDEGEPGGNSYPAHLDMTTSPAFSAVTATSAGELTWTRDGEDVDAIVEFTTSTYLDVAGLQTQRGRWLEPQHDAVGSEPVAVVSAATWRTRFGADPNIIGRTVELNGSPVRIVGVGPDRLNSSYPPLVTDFWLSISATAVAGQFRVANLERREDHWYDVRARMAPGVSIEQARSAMDGLAASLADRFPALNTGRRITVERATDVRHFPESDGILYTASAIAMTLLLLASANLANLLLVRGVGRSGEMAIRRALGAGRMRVIRLHLVEAVLLSVAGGIAGLGLAVGALAALPLAPLPSLFSGTVDIGIDGRVATFAILLMTGTGILFGLAPALRSSRHDVAGTLRDDSRTSSMSRGTLQFRRMLIVLQVAGSFVLILGAGLLGRSLLAMERTDTGVDVERLSYVRTSLTQGSVEGEDLGVLLEQVRARIEALPGVTRAAAISRLPAQSAGSTTTIVEGYQPQVGTGAVELDFMVASPEYFETTGLALLAGRGFAPTDIVGADRVVIINEAASRRFWGGIDPVGRRLISKSRPDVIRTVVGVVSDAPVDQFPEQTTPAMFYLPLTQAVLGTAYVVARTDGDAALLPDAMRSAVASVRGSLPIQAQGTMASHFDAGLAGPRFVVRTVAGVSLLAVLLAAVGIYAVVAFNVARRSSELSIRVALGADPARVVRMVTRDMLVSVGIGLVIGIALAALTVGRLEPALFGTRPFDAVAFAGSMLVLAAVASVAAYLPARRAAAADPAHALKAG